jgi:phage-related protein
MVLLEGSAGEYQPLVAAKAEARAATIRPRDVAPLRINRRLTSIAAVLAVLVDAVQFVPQLDPFGKVAAAEQTQEELRHIEESKQATQERLAKIERENLSDAQAKEVKQALDDLKAAMKGTQLKARQANFKLLAGAQKTVAGEWRKISSEKLNDLFSKSSAAASQQMGSNSGAMSKKWLDDLQAGSTESLKKEFSSIQRDLEELAKTKDPARKAELTQKLRERLDALTQFAQEQTGSKTLAAALKRTQEQMRMAAKAAASGDPNPKDPATEEALKAAAESAKLADKELEQIALSAKDLKDLEQALSVLQMAKNLNNKDLLDGQKMEGLQSMAEYEAMYAKLMKDAAPDTGEFGEGGPVEENDSKKSKFKTELSKSQISKGKVLLTLKTKGMGEQADVKEQYRSAVRDVKQGLSEAILREEIPPGYHEGIKGYFDSIEETPAAGK